MFRSLVLCLILNISVVSAGVVFAGEEHFPFLAEVTADQVNVRAGQSENFERLCRLKKGEEVIVIEKGYSWYKIQLPPSAQSFVHKDYVQFLGQNAGGVLGDRVNVRAGAGIHFTVLGQLTKGEQIYIQEESGDWYRIQPVANTYGWVSDQFLAFKSQDFEGHEAAIKQIFVDAELLEPAKEELEEEAPKEGESGEATIAEYAKSFYAVGYVEAYEEGKDDGVYYKITTGGRPVCYIQGQNHMLGRFKNLRVSVEGEVNQKLRSKYAHPVIVISKVRLML